MTARVGLGLLIGGLVAVGAWFAVGAVGSGAEPERVAAAVPHGVAGAAWGADGGEVDAAGQPLPVASRSAGAASGGAESGVTAESAPVGGASDAGALPPGTAASGTPASSTPASTTPASGAVAARTPGGTASALVSAPWASAVAEATGIPTRALTAYAAAALRLQAEQPSCGLGWNSIAALGWVESGHGTHGGSTVAADGVTRPGIFGPQLDGGAYAGITDSDGGRIDADAVWDRAVGPLQFIPQTWATWGADADGDGRADPQQIDDAALAAGRYLCHYGALTDPGTWRTAVFAYNHLDSYVDSVAEKANAYAVQSAVVPR